MTAKLLKAVPFVVYNAGGLFLKLAISAIINIYA